MFRGRIKVYLMRPKKKKSSFNKASNPWYPTCEILWQLRKSAGFCLGSEDCLHSSGIPGKVQSSACFENNGLWRSTSQLRLRGGKAWEGPAGGTGPVLHSSNACPVPALELKLNLVQSSADFCLLSLGCAWKKIAAAPLATSSNNCWQCLQIFRVTAIPWTGWIPIKCGYLFHSQRSQRNSSP